MIGGNKAIESLQTRIKTLLAYETAIRENKVFTDQDAINLLIDIDKTCRLWLGKLQEVNKE